MKKISLYAAALLAMTITACNDGDKPAEETATTEQPATNVPAPAQIPFSLVTEYPHDGTAFTEGLQFVDGVLYESTGQYGSSDVRKVNLTTGKVQQKQAMDAKYFGEGITVLNGKLYQLTYKEKTGIVYDAKTLKQIQTFSYPNAEGWGMTNDGTNLIYSDGTDELFFIDPVTFKEVKRIQVKDQYGTVTRINELEYIKGYIYANQWQADLIYKIDPATGNVVGLADLRNLRQQAGILALGQATDESQPEVMNGIAYDAVNNKIYITGKNWPKLFEVKLDN